MCNIITDYSKCECGAVKVYFESVGNNSLLKENLNKFQYKIISELVEEKPIENVIPFLKEVIKTKTLIYKKGRYRINDEVTKNIESIIK
jgi:hypothetical protein